jgi:parvulin-like peptidyl-prolyl isomerase
MIARISRPTFSIRFALLALAAIPVHAVAAEPVAIINGEAIGTDEFDRAWGAFAAQQEKLLTPQQMGAQWEKERKRLLLNQMIEQRLVLQAARKRGISVSAKEVDAAIAQLKERLRRDPQGRPLSAEDAEKAFQAELARESLTEKQFEKNVRNRMLAAALAAQLVKEKVKPPTDEEARKLFEAVKAELARPNAPLDSRPNELQALVRDFRAASAERVRVQRILFVVEDRSTVAQRRAAEKRAVEAKAKIEKGADFSDVAEAYSDDRRSASSGGDIGYVLRGEVPELDGTLFSLPVGDVSGVVKTKQGLQIFRITEKRATVGIRYRDARQYVMDYLSRAAERAEYARFVEGLKKAASIDIRAAFAKI